jgi:integrase/recombinase XerD
MGRLREKMARDLTLRGYSERTKEEYDECCLKFVRQFMRSPASLAHRQLSASTRGVFASALKFLYGVTLERPAIAAKIRVPRGPHKLPDILSGTETATLLAAIEPAKYRVALTVAYAAGLRIGEVRRLSAKDIDSRRMVIHVRLGKGDKDRVVMLSEQLLLALREYWRQTRPVGSYLFPGTRPGSRVSYDALRDALAKAVERVGLKKHVTAHVLRHTFATHLLEAGTDVRVIQALLGHRSVRTTIRYTQVSRRHIASVKSPLDLLGTSEGAVLG